MLGTSILKPEFLNIWNSIISKINFPENIEKYAIYFPVFLLGFLLTFLLTPAIGRFAKKYNIVYVPMAKRKGKDFDNPEKALHKGIIPALGGLAVMIPVLLLIIFCIKLDSITLPILIALIILVICGTLDDILNIPAKTQLLLQILASFVIVFSILDLNSFTFFGHTVQMDILKFQPIIGEFSFSLIFPGDLFLFVWLIFCINSFKWVSGSPGLIEGNALIVIFLIFIISIRHQTALSSIISILASGSLLAFLIFAYPPPLIMTGSSGKSVYGLLICCLGLISKTKFATSFMLLLLPSLDAIYVLIKRFIEYKPKNPFDVMKISGATHFHHQLLKLDMSQRQVFWIEMLITLVTGAIAIAITGALRYFLIIIAVILVISIILFTNFEALKKEKGSKKKEESSESKYSY
jgi:UDP-GlcNAc:undecaprenyl-phosphate GlcNAc-1-phosphate transferase